MPSIRASGWLPLSCILLLAATSWSGCGFQNSASNVVAVIPQSGEGLLWEAERKGASEAADKLGWQVSWKPPTTESDFSGQSALISSVAAGDYRGLVVAPNHVLGQIEPLRRVLSAEVPIVVISGRLELPATPNLGYVVNDDRLMGEMAAAEMAKRIDGNGPIALIGLARRLPGVSERALSAERYLAEKFPDIRIVSRNGGAYSSNGAAEIVAQAFAEHPQLKGVMTFTAVSTRGVHDAMRSNRALANLVLIGSEQDADLLKLVGKGEIDGLVAVDTYQMAYKAVGAISDFWSGKGLPQVTVVEPLLITPENYRREGEMALDLRGYRQ